MMTTGLAQEIVESLRKGQPPRRGVCHFSVGHEKLLEGIRVRHMNEGGDRGIIRFVSGSWGAGKTHFCRLLRELAFENEYLVSNVELSKDDAAFNRFERVVSAIVRNIQTPSHYHEGVAVEAAPFGRVLHESMVYLATGNHLSDEPMSDEHHARARELLNEAVSVDIDFKKLVEQYWETFFPERLPMSLPHRVQGEILQWFGAEGKLEDFRKRFGVNRMVSRETAKSVFQSLAGFVRFAGYSGLLIIFDETQQAYSEMRRSHLKESHDNLLSLLNNVDPWAGLFLVFATTPDFYDDEKHGIVVYPPIAGRIGKPSDQPPTPLQRIWNLDALRVGLEDYQAAAQSIRDIYVTAYGDTEEKLPPGDQVDDLVRDLAVQQAELEGVRFWRVMVTALVMHFDECLEGEPRSVEELYTGVIDQLRDGEE